MSTTHTLPAGARHTDRERARELLTQKIRVQRAVLADPHGFATIDPHFLIEDAEHRLRWLDCAPEGANHLVAPMQGVYGVPMGTPYNANLGPGRPLREAMDRRRGYAGAWLDAKIDQHEARRRAA